MSDFDLLGCALLAVLALGLAFVAGMIRGYKSALKHMGRGE